MRDIFRHSGFENGIAHKAYYGDFDDPTDLSLDNNLEHYVPLDNRNLRPR